MKQSTFPVARADAKARATPQPLQQAQHAVQSPRIAQTGRDCSCEVRAAVGARKFDHVAKLSYVVVVATEDPTRLLQLQHAAIECRASVERADRVEGEHRAVAGIARPAVAAIIGLPADAQMRHRHWSLRHVLRLFHPHERCAVVHYACARRGEHGIGERM